MFPNTCEVAHSFSSFPMNFLWFLLPHANSHLLALISGCCFWALPDQQSLVIFLLPLSYQPVGVLGSKDRLHSPSLLGVGSVTRHWIPKRLPSHAFLYTHSNTTRNRNGERKHPCPTPVLTSMGSVIVPPWSTCQVKPWYWTLSTLMILLGMP